MTTIAKTTTHAASDLTGVEGATTALAASSESASLLPPPCASMISDDAVTQLAVLMLQMDTNDRAAARTSEANQFVAQAREDAAQVAAMHKKADDIRSQGLVSGLLEIGTASLEFASSMASLSASSDEQAASEADKAAAKLDPGSEAREVLEDGAKGARESMQTAKTWAAYLSGAGKAVDALNKYETDHLGGAQADDDAEARMHANGSSVYEREGKRAADAAADARSAADKVLDWVKEMQSAAQGAQLKAASMLRG